MADSPVARLVRSYDSELNNFFVQKSSLQGATTLDRTPLPPQKRRSCVERVVNSPFIDLLIIINVVQMGIAVDLQHSPWDSMWKVFDSFVAAVFFGEMVGRIYLLRSRYFKRWLNIIDFSVAWYGLIDVLLTFYLNAKTQENMSIIQLLRLLRLLRFVRLLHVFPSVAPIIESMLASLKAMSLLFAMVCFVIYVTAIPCVTLIGTRGAGYPGYDNNEVTLRENEVTGFNNYRLFGTMARSMVTLFHLSMLSDEMVEVIRATAEIQRWPVFFFIGFILLMTLCLLNTILGVIVEKTVTSVLHGDTGKIALQQQKKVDALETLSELIQQFDEDQDGEISLAELKVAIQDPQLQELLHQISLPVGFTVEELFAMLDSDGSGAISYHEFTGGLFRIIYSNDFQRECLLRLGHAHIKACVWKMRDQVIAEMRDEHIKLIQEIRALQFGGGNRAGTESAIPPAEGARTASEALSTAASMAGTGSQLIRSKIEDSSVLTCEHLETCASGQRVTHGLPAMEVPYASSGAHIGCEVSNMMVGPQLASSQSKGDSNICSSPCSCESPRRKCSWSALSNPSSRATSKRDVLCEFEVPDALRGAQIAVETSKVLLMAQMAVCRERSDFSTDGNSAPAAFKEEVEEQVDEHGVSTSDEGRSKVRTAHGSSSKSLASKLNERKLIL